MTEDTKIDALNSDIRTNDDDFSALESRLPHLALVLFGNHRSDIGLDTSSTDTLRAIMSASH